jgi:hypothetical protein
VPFALCACSICRKVGGFSGSINLGGIAKSLKITKGEDLIMYASFSLFALMYYIPIHFFLLSFHILCIMAYNWLNSYRKYSAVKDRNTPTEERCVSERNFCSNCSTMLWLWDHQWPELIHPFAAAIDTELPIPPKMVCIFNNSKPKWARWPEGEKEVYEGYPGGSLEMWHKDNGLWVE